MKVETFANSNGGMTVSATLDGALMAVAGPRIMNDAMDLIAKGIADAFLRDHGAEVLAQIPVKAMINRTISKTVEKYGKFLDTEPLTNVR